MKRKLLTTIAFGVISGVVLLFAACTGPQGPAGPTGPAGAAGPQGIAGPLPPGVGRQLSANVTVSKPANSTHFVAGEPAVLTITLKDQTGAAFDRANDFLQLRLMLAGPQETTETVTAVKLLKTSADRSLPVHHFVDLMKNADVQVSGTTLTYKLAAVSDEKPGTYIASVWGVSKADSFQQFMNVAEFQIGTATVEKQIVEKEKCASCHLGASSGKFYFHHIDQIGFFPAGNFAIDQNAVRNCKTCHNNDGYSATLREDGKTRDVASPIVKKVHGVHMGEELKNPLNIDPKTGLFKDYLHVVFPADVRNCTKCHVDDRWKTKPSQMACGACHDNVWFGELAKMPKKAEAHPGGPQPNDSGCATCHPADTGGMKPIAEAHKIKMEFQNTVELALTAPRNGKSYVAGEKPKVTITIKDAKTGAVINPNTMLEPKVSTNVTAGEWRGGRLFVSGPREGTKPVLTTAALADNKTYTYAANDFRVRLKPTDEDPRITRSGTAITYQLDDVKNLKAGTYTAFVYVVPATGTGGSALINFQVGTETPDKLIATNCTTCHEDTRMHGPTLALPFNPDYCKNCHDYERQRAGFTAWTTSNSGFGAGPFSRRIHGVHYGHYVDKPTEIHAREDYSGVIFPQDVRNCTKCHDAAGSTAWKEKPSRLACFACHDSDSAIAHGALMIIDPTPADQWSGDEVETCKTCHGAGKDFAPDKVHNISNPYKPPYPREPAE
ncbi:MAG: hypothetical protein AABZ77_06265 [Chloroflexota bacterium]